MNRLLSNRLSEEFVLILEQVYEPLIQSKHFKPVFELT
jgi:hypothetical protein